MLFWNEALTMFNSKYKLQIDLGKGISHEESFKFRTIKEAPMEPAALLKLGYKQDAPTEPKTTSNSQILQTVNYALPNYQSVINPCLQSINSNR
jgi:hypothetical protein